MSTFSMPCPACRAQLHFSMAQSGVSGPCNYCGALVTATPPSAGFGAAPQAIPPSGHYGMPSAPQVHPQQGPSGSSAMRPEYGSGLRRGRFVGVLLAVLGVLGTGLSLFLLARFGWTIKILIAFPALGLWGVALVIFPGAPVSMSDVSSGRFPRDEYLREAPLHHKIVWAIAGGVGVILGIATLF